MGLDVAAFIRKGKELKKGLREDAQAFFEQIHCTVDDLDLQVHKVPDSVTNRVLSVVSQTLRDLMEAGAPVRRSIEGMGLLTLKLDAGDHIKRQDPDSLQSHESNALAEYEKSAATLRIAAEMKMGSRSAVPCVGKGKHNVGRDFRTVFTHEVGHLVMDEAEQTARRKFRIIYDLHPQEFWEDNVSIYAGKNDHELFAECFAAYTSAYYRGDLPQEVVDYFVDAGLLPMVRKAKRGGSTADQSVSNADWSVVGDAITSDLEKTYSEMYGAEAKNAGLEVDTEVINEEAAAYAEERAAQLVADISETTRDNLRADVAASIEDGQTYSQFADSLMDSYDFSAARAETIARTELAMANVQAHVSASSDAGAVGKRWLLSDDHDFDDDCNDNADEDVIAFDEDWASGDDWPPSHPNCQCDFEAIYPDDPDAQDLLDEEDDEEDDADKLHKIHKPHIARSGKKFKVVDTDGHVYGTHPTKAKAQAQVRALYANKSAEPH